VKTPPEELNHISIARESKRLMDQGVSVQIGAHGQREGLGAHWELWMFEQGGMSAHESLRVGTINGARALGMDKDIGSLEVGKLADLVLWEGDPLDVGHYAEQVWLGGRAMPMRSRQTELRDRYQGPASSEPRAYSR